MASQFSTGRFAATDMRITLGLGVALAAWACAVSYGASVGFFARLYPPVIGLMVACGIAVPVAIYFASPIMRAYFARIGLYPITILHIWRIPAALLFFGFGATEKLPTIFWVLAGTGDLIAGCLALPLLRGPVSRSAYIRIHGFGFFDFVIAVGTGLTLTLLDDPLMSPIGHLPLALIPLFGVGVSGASHIIAFHLLWAGRDQSGKALIPA